MDERFILHITMLHDSCLGWNRHCERKHVRLCPCTPRHFAVLAADPGGYYLAFAPELHAAGPSVN